MKRLSQISLGTKVGLDTSVLIYYFNRHYPYFPNCHTMLRAIEGGELRGVISVVTEMELLVAPLAQGRHEIVKSIEEFLRHLPGLEIVPVDRSLAKRAAKLRADTKLRGIDALVATTAIAAECPYLIGNDREFARRVTGIDYLVLEDYL